MSNRRTCNKGYALPASEYVEWEQQLRDAGKWLVAEGTGEYFQTYSNRRGEFIVDEYREAFVGNPQCVQNHRTREAAVNCGKRYAKMLGLVARRQEDVHYI
jgi:hypothetical protein